MLLGLLLLLAALHLGLNRSTGLRFDQEKIEIWAFPEQIQVTGIYHYQNHSIFPVSFSLGVPFPVDSGHPWPAAFHVSEINVNGALRGDVRTRSYHGDTVFRLWFWPFEGRWIRLDYVQGAHVPQARYILLTTRNWGLPLERADYVLHLGEGLELLSSNYPLTLYDHGFQGYFFSRAKFLPFEDWEFRWRAKVAQGIATKDKL